jgi:iron complex outermembrane recepter protein
MNRDLFGSLLASGSVAALCCAAPAHAQHEVQFEFSVPAQDLALSLREISRRTGRSIIAPSGLVRGRRSPAVSGSFTAEEAVRRLLSGSGLDVLEVGDSLVVVMPATGEASGPGQSSPALGSDETIVVTGTNIRGARPTAPTIVIGREAIDRSGATSVEQLMRQVPQNSQSGVNQETANSTQAGGDSTEHGAGLNLRGLGQRATLVLLNGRRLAPSSGGSYVDISLIPLTAVRRVELLTDGASAIYGSDAVGGVVNFILRDDFEGVETSLLLGSATRGDGDQLQAGLTAGTSWGGGHALIAYEYRLEDEIVAADRPFTINLRPGAFLLPNERRHSLLAVAGQSLTQDLRVDLTGSYSRRDTERTYFFVGNPQPVGQQAQAESLNLSASLRYRISGGWEARLDGGYYESRGEQLTEQEGAGLVNSRSTVNRLRGVTVNIDGPLLDLPAGALRLALGGEFRHESLDDRNSTALVSNNVRKADRDIWSAHGELLVPLFGPANRLPLIERLEVSLAGRLEHYRGLGSTFNPKAGLLWAPLPDVSFRASYDTSFRAPLLSETLGAYTAVYGPARLVYINPAEGQGVALVLGGANPGVTPERSKSWTLGAEFTPRPLPGLRASLNYYSIRFSDRIALPSRIVTVVGNPAFEPIVDRNPTADQVAELVGAANLVIDISGPGFSNGNATPGDVTVIVDNRINNTAVTTTRGLDFLLSYDFEAGGNRFGLHANLNRVLDFTDRLTTASPPVQKLDTPYNALEFRGRAGATWSRGGWSGHLFGNYANPYDDNRGAVLRRVEADFTVDAGLSYRVGRGNRWLQGTQFAVNAVNLFDREPPRLVPDPGSTTGPGYDPVNSSARGRFLSFQIRRTW